MFDYCDIIRIKINMLKWIDIILDLNNPNQFHKHILNPRSDNLFYRYLLFI